MVDILLCCAPEDRETAVRIAHRLEQNAEVRVIFDDTDSESVAAKAVEGLPSTAGVVVLLSTESVPAQVSRESWGALLDHIAGNSEPPVACVLLRACGYPRILERGKFHRWEGNEREVLRALQSWAIRLHKLPLKRSFEPARLSFFEGREAEFDWLHDQLVDRASCALLFHDAPASGKTSLAQEFCRRAAGHYRDIVWCACNGRSLTSIAADLAEQLEVERLAESEATLAEAVRLAGRHRVLLVLDGLPCEFAPSLEDTGRASVLITSRSVADLEPPHLNVLRISASAPAEPATPRDSADLRLWRAMAVCRTDGFSLDLAARIAGLSAPDAQAACARLVEARLADPLDEARGLFRLNALSVAAAGDQLDDERRHHAALLKETFSRWREDMSSARRLVAELDLAFRWAVGADWPIACSLARRGCDYLAYAGRLAESAELLVSLRDAAIQRGDQQTADECAWDLSFARNETYRGAARATPAGEQIGFDFSA